MNLVKIDGVYINVDMVDAVSFGSTKGITHVFVGGSEHPFIFNRSIDEVVAIIEADKEESEAEDGNDD